MDLPPPLYILPQVKKRAIISKIITLMLLGIIFYLGVILNLALLNLDQKIHNLVQLTAAGIIFFCLVLGTIAAIAKSNRKYLFYRDRIVFGKKQLFYQEITSIDLKKNFWDGLFHTSVFQLNKKFAIKNIPVTINISDYLKKLIAYSKGRS